MYYDTFLGICAFLDGQLFAQKLPLELTDVAFRNYKEFLQPSHREECEHGGLFYKDFHVHILPESERDNPFNIMGS